jgi:hypothetical protein
MTMAIRFTTRPTLGRRPRYLALLGLALLCALLLMPPPARADAPVTRGQEQPTSQGSLAHSAAIANAWQGLRALPVQSRSPGTPYTLRPRPQAQDDGVWSWLGLEPNIGKWVMDSGLGVTGGIAATTNQTLLLAIQSSVGDMSSIASCESATSFIFCAPEAMFFGGAGFSVAGIITTTWRVLSPIGIGLVTVTFVIRLGRLIVEGPSSLTEEGKRLIPTFLATVIFVSQPAALLRPCFTLANTVSATLLQSIPPDAISRLLANFQPSAGGISLASNMVSLVLMIVTLLVIFKAAGRMFRLFALLAVAPLMGALLLDRATAPRFWAWLIRTVDTLLGQIPLVIFFWLGVLFWQPHGDISARFGDISAGILSIFTFGMMLGGETILAGLGIPSTPSSMVGRLIAAAAIQRAIPTGRRMPNIGAAAAQPATAAGSKSFVATTHPRSNSGDPTTSAAARRGQQNTSQLMTRSRAPESAGAFRIPRTDAADGRDQLVSARMRAAQSAPQWDAQAGRLTDAGRARAAQRAGMMRRQARSQRESGNAAGADELMRKAAIHEHMARTGETPGKPGRTPEENERRRAAYRQAGLEVQGERAGSAAQQAAQHAIERAQLAAQNQAVQARRDELPGAIARTRASSEARAAHYEAQGDYGLAANARAAGQRRIDALDHEYVDLSGSIRSNQARLHAIKSAERNGRGVDATVRAETARRARERLGEPPTVQTPTAARPRLSSKQAPTPFTRRTLQGARQLRGQEIADKQQAGEQRATQAQAHAQATRKATALERQQRAARLAQARSQVGDAANGSAQAAPGRKRTKK